MGHLTAFWSFCYSLGVLSSFVGYEVSVSEGARLLLSIGGLDIAGPGSKPRDAEWTCSSYYIRSDFLLCSLTLIHFLHRLGCR